MIDFIQLHHLWSFNTVFSEKKNFFVLSIYLYKHVIKMLNLIIIDMGDGYFTLVHFHNFFHFHSMLKFTHQAVIVTISIESFS